MLHVLQSVHELHGQVLLLVKMCRKGHHTAVMLHANLVLQDLLITGQPQLYVDLLQ